MIRDDLNVLADALQNSRHDNGAEQRTELIADAGQCILLCVKAGQLFWYGGRQTPLRASSCARVGPQSASTAWCRHRPPAAPACHGRIPGWKRSWCGSTGFPPAHAHAVAVGSGPQIAAADPDVIRLLAVILRIFQALGICLLAYLCQCKGKVLQLIRKRG